MPVIIPPIKSQGIKTKLVPWINDLILTSGVSLTARWIEPFFGTGVVGFNCPIMGTHIVGDTNPHIINFYQKVQNGEVTPYTMRAYLEHEGRLLEVADEDGYAHYRLVRDRFNQEHSPYDFIFLSRAGFNGMMRFNKQGCWNIPFCKKPERFAPAYITKICNQIENIARVIRGKQWVFNNVHFLETIAQAGENDIIYCDPPYAPLSETSSFTSYSKSGFDLDEQKRLAETAKQTARRAHGILISNHDTTFTREIYRGAVIKTVEVQRSIAAKGSSRKKVGELLAIYE